MYININISIMGKMIFITGGGTGGHLFPAISIGEELIKRGFSIIYIGSKHGIEKKYFKKNRLTHYLLNIKGIQRNLSFKSIINNILLPFRFTISYILSIALIKKYKPVTIIGTGGYASALPLIAARHLNIPIMIQEQNSIPGITTRLMAKNAKKIFLGFKYSEKLFTSNNSIYTGNPIRKDLKILNKNKCKSNLKFDKNKKLVLIIGGSQGARPINKYINENIDFFIKNDIQLMWQVGSLDYNTINRYNKYKNIKITEFITDMSEAYSAADIVVSRAGAIAISELTFFKKAMILIPLPSAANNHQNINANYLNERKACIIINQAELNEKKLEKTILDLLKNEKKINQLKQNADSLSMPKATINIINNITRSI